MPQTLQQKEAENMERLINMFSKLRDPEHRRKFHEYLSKYYNYGLEKPATYDDLEEAYLDFIQSSHSK